MLFPISFFLHIFGLSSFCSLFFSHKKMEKPAIVSSSLSRFFSRKKMDKSTIISDRLADNFPLKNMLISTITTTTAQDLSLDTLEKYMIISGTQQTEKSGSVYAKNGMKL
jgi:hypothetical protein